MVRRPLGVRGESQCPSAATRRSALAAGLEKTPFGVSECGGTLDTDRRLETIAASRGTPIA